MTRIAAGKISRGLPQALAWLLAKGDDLLPIPGTTSRAHLSENLKAADVSLSADIIERLDAHFSPEKPVGPRYLPSFQKTVDTEQFEFERSDA